MAEIRKHNPKTSAIGDLVRAAAGETIRPVTPGQDKQPTSPAPAQRPDTFDPFDDGERPVSEQPKSFTVTSGAAGSWFSFSRSAKPATSALEDDDA